MIFIFTLQENIFSLHFMAFPKYISTFSNDPSCDSDPRKRQPQKSFSCRRYNEINSAV